MIYESCGAALTRPDPFVIKSDVDIFWMRKARRRARSSSEPCAESRPQETSDHHNIRQNYAFRMHLPTQNIANPLFASETDLWDFSAQDLLIPGGYLLDLGLAKCGSDSSRDPSSIAAQRAFDRPRDQKLSYSCAETLPRRLRELATYAFRRTSSQYL